MLESLAKNLWLLLTIVIPGFFTYGMWRILLLLEPSSKIDADALMSMDDSAMISTSVIFAIALLQQAIAIAAESIFTLLAKMNKNHWPSFYALFCERFALAASKMLDEKATRIIGNFFLSFNVTIGLSLLLLFFIVYEKLSLSHWIPILLICFIIVALITTIFRMFNAEWVIEECKKNKIIISP